MGMGIGGLEMQRGWRGRGRGLLWGWVVWGLEEEEEEVGRRERGWARASVSRSRFASFIRRLSSDFIFVCHVGLVVLSGMEFFHGELGSVCVCVRNALSAVYKTRYLQFLVEKCGEGVEDLSSGRGISSLPWSGYSVHWMVIDFLSLV